MRKELLRISHVDLERDGELLLDDLEFQMFAGEIVGLVARNRKGQKEMVDLICRNDPPLSIQFLVPARLLVGQPKRW